nr:hypothetical protein [Tanacetum cinerariifolium]
MEEIGIARLAALRSFGYTIVSIFDQGDIANVLNQVPNFRYYWRSLLQNRMLWGLANQPNLEMIPVQQQMARNGAIGIFWDFDSMGFRGYRQHEIANQRLLSELTSLGILYYQTLACNSGYGETANISIPDHCLEEVRYRDTTPEPKENSLENTIIVDMLSFGFQCRPPSSIILLTQIDKLTNTFLTLKSRGYITIMCTPSAATRANFRFLRHAATHVI